MSEQDNSVSQEFNDTSSACISEQSQTTTVSIVPEEQEKKDKNSQDTQKSQLKLKLLFSITIGILLLITGGITIYFLLSTDEKRTLPQKVLMEIESNSDKKQGKQEIYLNYDDQIMQQSSKQTKIVNKDKLLKLNLDEEGNEESQNKTQILEKKKIIHKDYKLRKQWTIKISEFSILCKWSHLKDEEKMIPQVVGEDFEFKEEYQKGQSKQYRFQSKEKKKSLKVEFDQNSHMKNFEIEENDGEKNVLYLRSKLLSTDPKTPEFESLIKDIECHYQDPQVKNQVFQSTCADEKMDLEIQKEIEKQNMKIDEQFQQQQGDGEGFQRRVLGFRDSIEGYANWCGSERGGYEKHSRCYDTCQDFINPYRTWVWFNECASCLKPKDEVDRACMHHDRCCFEEWGDNQACKYSKLHQNSCMCSTSFIEDNYDANCQNGFYCNISRVKHIAAFKFLRCGCTYQNECDWIYVGGFWDSWFDDDNWEYRCSTEKSCDSWWYCKLWGGN